MQALVAIERLTNASDAQRDQINALQEQARTITMSIDGMPDLLEIKKQQVDLKDDVKRQSDQLRALAEWQGVTFTFHDSKLKGTGKDKGKGKGKVKQ